MPGYLEIGSWKLAIGNSVFKGTEVGGIILLVTKLWCEVFFNVFNVLKFLKESQ